MIIDANDFAGDDVASSGFHFGIGGPSSAAALRRLAALIDERRALPQTVSVSSVAKSDDYALTTLTFAWVERSADGD